MRLTESWFLAYLLNALWQVPLIYAVTKLFTFLLRGRDVVIEHRMWVISLGLQVLVPTISLPYIDVPRFFRQMATWSVVHGINHRDPRISVNVGAGIARGSLGFPEWLLTAIIALYLACAVYFLARLLWGLWKAQGLGKEAEQTPASPTIRQQCSRLASTFGVTQYGVVVSNAICGPIVIGIFHKIMLLPEEGDGDFTQHDLDAAIAHEFAHMKRNDFAKNLLYEILCLPVAFHPIARMTLKYIAETREMVCDALAANAVDGPRNYAKSLVRLASSMMSMPKPSIHAIGIFDANTLERRIMTLTKKRKESHTAFRIAVWIAYVAIVCGTSVSAMALRMHVFAPGMSSSLQDQNGPARISGGVMAGQIVSKVQPVYPDGAKTAGISGSVVLHAIIGKEGNITKLAVISGPPELAPAAMDAVKQWVYKPYLLNGNPTEVDTTITVNFALAQ